MDAGFLPDGGPICNNMVFTTSSVVIATNVAAVEPTVTGGTVPSGRYHLTNLTVYTGVGGASGPGTAEVRSDFVLTLITAKVYTLNLVQKWDSVFVDNVNSSWVLSGTNATAIAQCGASYNVTQGYSWNSSASKLTVHIGGGMVAEYTKQ